MNQKILCIEDQKEIQILLRKTLSSLQVESLFLEKTSDARQFLQSQNVSLILLDIELPEQNGLEYFHELQSDEKTKNIPVIFITGKKDISNKITAFSLGAEDYIMKPFDPMEVKARIESKLKKLKNTEEQKQKLIRGKLSLDSSTQKATVTNSSGEKNSLRLTSKEFHLLFYLALHEEQVLSRTQILEAIWSDPGEVYDRTVDTHIASLRKKLGECSTYIESVSGSGYRFSSTHKK